MISHEGRDSFVIAEFVEPRVHGGAVYTEHLRRPDNADPAHKRHDRAVFGREPFDGGGEVEIEVDGLVFHGRREFLVERLQPLAVPFGRTAEADDVAAGPIENLSCECQPRPAIRIVPITAGEQFDREFLLEVPAVLRSQPRLADEAAGLATDQPSSDVVERGRGMSELFLVWH